MRVWAHETRKNWFHCQILCARNEEASRKNVLNFRRHVITCKFIAFHSNGPFRSSAATRLFFQTFLHSHLRNHQKSFMLKWKFIFHSEKIATWSLFLLLLEKMKGPKMMTDVISLRVKSSEAMGQSLFNRLRNLNTRLRSYGLTSA